MLFFIKPQQSKLITTIMPCFITGLFLASLMILPNQSFAQSSIDLPTPGNMVSLSPSFTPALIKGITLYPNHPLKFDFLISPGDDNLKGEELINEADKLIKYFMASLTVPEDEMWVNLSP